MAMSPALTGTALAVSLPARVACGWTAWRQQQMQSPHRVLHARGLARGTTESFEVVTNRDRGPPSR